MGLSLPLPLDMHFYLMYVDTHRSDSTQLYRDVSPTFKTGGELCWWSTVFLGIGVLYTTQQMLVSRGRLAVEIDRISTDVAGLFCHGYSVCDPV
jgi:hypothetical protein